MCHIHSTGLDILPRWEYPWALPSQGLSQLPRLQTSEPRPLLSGRALTSGMGWAARLRAPGTRASLHSGVRAVRFVGAPLTNATQQPEASCRQTALIHPVPSPALAVDQVTDEIMNTMPELQTTHVRKMVNALISNQPHCGIVYINKIHPW